MNEQAQSEDLAAELEAIHAKLDALLAAQSAPTPRFLSVDHAAVYADLSQNSIRRMIGRGDLTGLRPTKGKVLVDRLELDRLILGSTRQPRNSRGAHLHRRG